MPLLRCCLLLVTLFISAAPLLAQNAVGDIGLLIPVPSPLSSEDISRIKKRVDEARAKGAERPAKIVFDFTPTEKDAISTSFGPCSDLADFISKLNDVGTVGFLRKKVSGHLVLPVLVCKDIAMGENASLGEVLTTGVEAMSELQRTGYKALLAKRYEAQWPLIQKMYDPELQVVFKGQKVIKEVVGGVQQDVRKEWFVDSRDAAAQEKAGVVISDRTPITLPKNGLYSAQEATSFDLCKVLVNTREELASRAGINPATLRDDPLSDRTPKAFMLKLEKQVNNKMKEFVVRQLKTIKEQKGNLLFLFLECRGGEVSVAASLADEIIKATREGGANAVKVIAVIQNVHAQDTATVIALGCSEIVMSKREDVPDGGETTIGDFEKYLVNKKNPEVEERVVRDLAEKQGYPDLLIRGMFERNLEIHRVRGRVDRTQRQLMTKEDFEKDKDKWVSEGIIKPRDKLLKLTATQAQELGLARVVVKKTDPNEVYEYYGVAGKVKEATPGWVDQFAAYVRLEVVTVLLVVIGFIGLLLELKVPGTTIPGIIAALCFILVFWAHTQFSGQVVVLAGLLFVLGLVLILLEVFVFPGFGASGIFGIMLILASLGLVTMDAIPSSGDQWLSFGGKMAKYMFSLIVALMCAFFIARYLPKTPLGRQLALSAPDEKELEEAGTTLLPGAAQAAALLGAIGVAATVLRPAGTVRIGDDFVDVVTEGGYIAAGTRVQVVEVEGTRIVVKEV